VRACVVVGLSVESGVDIADEEGLKGMMAKCPLLVKEEVEVLMQVTSVY
jgi:hypothetical protein